ncbi:MAG: tRNA 2-thiouridine(34) synthase MnmA [Planctomycetes bacterium]|nr:tRNA 2-thiouridine(34) synthase MnmA [Planctomycetota bacterium]MBL7144406.1 tRNA 2-thiouridine(34) synthase MnmA [Phycisphaerae bacterium]
MTTDKWNIKLLGPSFSPWCPDKDRSRPIAVLMSGGVDSSVTAYLLKEQGWDVLGITMKIPVSCNTNKRGCCGADAAFVCGELNIPHYFVDVTEAFEELIIKQFRQSYSRGETPNPCVDCNTLLKFSLLWDFLEETFGISYLATGHYARVSKSNGQMRLGRAMDKTKDQSYFIYGMPPEKLQRFVLPLGELSKNEVRSTAAQLNLSVADKAESMELCFAGEGDYRLALNDAEANQQGNIIDMQGNRIGTHKGIANYTLGQRQGIGYAGGKPLYVGKIDAEANTIALGTREEVSTHTLRANRINTLIPEELVLGRKFFGKIRSYGDPQPCKLIDIGGNSIKVNFGRPQFAPCPGQRLVLYNDSDNIVAGGTISAQK